jgi:rfaE bifunctional protein nucleotidyltransferase chain/domain
MMKKGKFKKDRFKPVSYKEMQRNNNLSGYGSKEEDKYQETPENVIRESLEDMAKRGKQKIVFTNGCFDILHPGHVKLLKEAKSYGDKLIVGLNTDKSIAGIKPGRPMLPQEDRVSIMKAIRYVDEVILFDEPTPIELIKKLKPDVLVKGGDYTVDQIIGHELVPEVRIVPLTPHSTTKIIDKIRATK